MSPVPQSTAVPVLRVTADGRTFRFSHNFEVGRAEDCAICIQDPHISSKHLMVWYGNGCWMFRDLNSRNGIFIDGERIGTAPVEGTTTIHLGGVDGATVTLELENAVAAAPRAAAVAQAAPAARSETMVMNDLAERYFGSAGGDQPAGDRTIMIRKAFQQIQKKQKRKHRWVVVALGIAVVAAAGYAFYGYRQIQQQQNVAQDLFYSMKALDVDIATVERLVAASGSPQAQAQISKNQERRREMESDYDRFLSGLNVYNRRLSPQEQLILRITRTFGECEIAAPPEYLAEVGTYIKRWQSTGRFTNALKIAQDRGYIGRIQEEFGKQDLPPQFFYLAMQESGFDTFISGPQTSWGIAKGMWQFIPDTGKRYGLTIGPLASVRRPDPGDERQNWEKATVAAARYIKDIYSTDAQASGLLVIGSYNWGEHRIIDLIRKMPMNPRERNWWKLLTRYKERVPKETYDYVLNIVSAAVIGENPRLFGFPFDNPLASVAKR